MNTAARADAVWADLLDELEAELAGSSTLAGSSELAGPPAPAATAGPPTAWHPPADVPPLPGHLADRARRVADAHAARIGLLHDELDALRTHLDALARIPAPAGDDAVYLDLDG